MELEKFISPELLEDNADSVEEKSIQHNYTKEELEERIEKFYQVNLEKNERERLAKGIKLVIDEGYDRDELVDYLANLDLENIGSSSIKSLKEEHKALIDDIKLGFEIRKVKIYGFANYYEDIMALYKPDGHLYGTRPLYEEERQLRINSNLKIS